MQAVIATDFLCYQSFMGQVYFLHWSGTYHVPYHYSANVYLYNIFSSNLFVLRSYHVYQLVMGVCYLIKGSQLGVFTNQSNNYKKLSNSRMVDQEEIIAGLDKKEHQGYYILFKLLMMWSAENFVTLFEYKLPHESSRLYTYIHQMIICPCEMCFPYCLYVLCH